jgi:hypothetical protein
MTAKVVKLAIRENIGHNSQEYDPVFFRKEDIKIGVRLVNYGRRDPGSVWVVRSIRTFKLLPSGKYRVSHIDEVTHLSDIVTVNRIPPDDDFISEREPTFGSLSYSAIWRLAE